MGRVGKLQAVRQDYRIDRLSCNWQALGLDARSLAVTLHRAYDGVVARFTFTQKLAIAPPGTDLQQMPPKDFRQHPAEFLSFQ